MVLKQYVNGSGGWLRGAVVGMLAVGLMGAGVLLGQEDEMREVLKNAKVTSRPAEVSGPEAMAGPVGTQPAGDFPARARVGNVVLSDGTKIDGRVWTTLETPLRVWMEATKSYQDVDFESVKVAEVVVDEAAMEADWRWLKEGSDVKVYSGKKYPMVSLRYRLTLVNGQVVEGTVVAPVFVFDGKKVRSLALYKKFKGELGQTMGDVVYIKAMTLEGSAAVGDEKKTTKLPLIED